VKAQRLCTASVKKIPKNKADRSFAIGFILFLVSQYCDRLLNLKML